MTWASQSHTAFPPDSVIDPGMGTQPKEGVEIPLFYRKQNLFGWVPMRPPNSRYYRAPLQLRVAM